MTETSKILSQVREALAASDRVLKEARDRRGLVLEAANAFEGIRDQFNSGSIAHGTANSDLDADCGAVLDRRRYPDLGPDGRGVGPNAIVAEMRELVAERLHEEDDGIEVRLTKRRAINVTFPDKVDGFNPSVDLLVALERKNAPGVWIPNRPEDDPADPAKHTQLFTSGSKALKQVRARAVRLAKGWNGQYANPALSSFNLEALAWECVEETMNEAEALAELFAYGAKELAGGETDDPADVSGPIRLLLDRDQVVNRLEIAASLMQRALEHEDDQTGAREALSELFWDYVEPPKGSSSKAAFASELRKGKSLGVGTGGLTLGAGRISLKPTRSYGDESAG